MKDIEWLKDEILTDMRYLEGNREIRQLDIKYQTLREVAQKINSLDEPEVLSQEWIDEHKESWQDLSITGYSVPEKDLQNLLVPKQKEITEEQAWEVIHGKYGNETLQNNIDYIEYNGYVVTEKPTIPQFVADWIEGHRFYNVFGALTFIANKENSNHPQEMWEWVFEEVGNLHVFIRAWLDGYEVEKEQKYYAKIKGHENIYSDICFWIYDTEIEELLIDNAEIYPDVTAGYMIKATKDEWASLGINDDNADFVKVEEMEE